MSGSARRLAQFAWGGLAFTVAVVLWGAYVRATGAGAGCGDHWPLCNGQVIPQAAAVKTLIEFTHRTTSGLAFVFTLVLAVWTFRVHPKGHAMRKGAAWSLFFMVMEAAIGAGLVLFKLVAHDESIARGYAMSAHLINTFLLLAALTLTAGASLGERAPRLRGQGALGTMFVATAVGMMVLGVSGAIAALGDTLFPATSLSHGLKQDFETTAHVFLRLRLLHPMFAAVVGLMVGLSGWMASSMRPSAQQKRYAVILTALVATQLLGGLLNLVLLAPVWMQLVHLLLADAVWIAFVRTGGLAMAQEAVAAPSAASSELQPAR